MINFAIVEKLEPEPCTYKALIQTTSSPTCELNLDASVLGRSASTSFKPGPIEKLQYQTKTDNAQSLIKCKQMS